eukprot:bmy_20825T0
MKNELSRTYSEVTEFILLGFRTSPEVWILLFLFFLRIYMVTVVGNISMLVVTKIDSRLHTPISLLLHSFLLAVMAYDRFSAICSPFLYTVHMSQQACVQLVTVILVSYAYFLSTVLKIPSTRSRSKTFSACSSHITVVSLFYGTLFFKYAQPGAVSSPEKSKIIAVFCALIIPMLNPLIYSLRNRENESI